MPNKRKERSDKHAQRVCRELRYLLANGGAVDFDLIWPHFKSWMNNTGKKKYERPKLRPKK
jgi:hypothetical protein